METTGSATLVWVGFLVLGLSLSIAAVVIVLRWKRLKPELFTESADTLATATPRLQTVRDGLSARLLARSTQMLAESDAAASRTLSRIAALPEAAKQMDGLILESLKLGEIKSLLFGAEGSYVYVVAIPNRHEHAHLLRRHGAFAAGWTRHARALRSSLSARSDGSPEFAGMVSLLLFLSAEGGESVLQIAYADRTTLSVPATLAEAGDNGAEGVRLSDAALEFNLAA